jgi:hypothetical protein
MWIGATEKLSPFLTFGQTGTLDSAHDPPRCGGRKLETTATFDEKAPCPRANP